MHRTTSMAHFDAVERVFLRDPRVYRVFATPDRLYFIRIGNIVRVADEAVSALDGLSPEEMLSLDGLNHSIALQDIQQTELITSHFLLGHGLFWRFREPGGKQRTFILHQWGDMTAAVATLFLTFGRSLSTAKVDDSMRATVQAAAERSRRLPPLSSVEGISKPVAMGDASARPSFQRWRHSRTWALSVILLICVLVSAFLRNGCR